MDEELEELLESYGFYDEPHMAPQDSSQKNGGFIAQFLGTRKQYQVPANQPTYYADLLTWALQSYINAAG